VRRFGHSLDRWAHFDSGVEEDNRIQRLFLVAEVGDRLGLPTVRHAKTFSSKTADELAILVNLGVNMNKGNVAVEGGLVLGEEQEK